LSFLALPRGKRLTSTPSKKPTYVGFLRDWGMAGGDFSLAGALEDIAIDIVIAEELLEILNRSHADVRAQRKRDAEPFRRDLRAREAPPRWRTR
jgi:hypothetical protein